MVFVYSYARPLLGLKPPPGCLYCPCDGNIMQTIVLTLYLKIMTKKSEHAQL